MYISILRTLCAGNIKIATVTSKSVFIFIYLFIYLFFRTRRSLKYFSVIFSAIVADGGEIKLPGRLGKKNLL